MTRRVPWKRWIAAGASLLLACVLELGIALGETYPARPIRLLVPVGPGAGLDTRAREVAAKLSELLGQHVVVENRPGAGGIIALNLAAKSAPDGYTLALSGIGPIAYYPVLYRKLPYGADDFLPVSLLATGPSSVYVGPSFPANTVQELVALAKARPGELTFASQGSGTFQHLAGEWFKTAVGVDLVHVPYKDYGQILADVESGRVSILFDSTGAVLGHVQSGKLKALAVTGDRRLPTLRDVPTFTEAGIFGYEPGINYGIFAPAGTPTSVIDTLAVACAKVGRSKDIQASIERFGFVSRGTTPAEFADYVAGEAKRWSKVIRMAGLQLDN